MAWQTRSRSTRRTTRGRAPARNTRSRSPTRFSSRKRAPARRRAASVQTVRIVLEQPQPQVSPAFSNNPGNVVAMTPRKARF